MKKVIVYGSTIFSKMLYYDAIDNDDFIIEAFAVDSEYLDENFLMGLPIVDVNQVHNIYSPEKYDMIVVFSGYEEMRKRQNFYDKIKSKGYFLRNYFSRNAQICEDIEIGENNIFMSNSYIGPRGKMGNNNLIRQNVYLGHDFNIGDNNVISPGCNIAGRCIIQNICYIGIGSTIIEGRLIRNETLIGAGSVVIKDTEEASKNVGNPSKIIGYHKDKGIKLGGNNG